ncbi:unnamed protein product, partial [Tenebrio molitor]
CNKLCCTNCKSNSIRIILFGNFEKLYLNFFFLSNKYNHGSLCAPNGCICNALLAPSTPKGSVPQNLFKGMKDISRATAAPRKLKLMDTICRKEDHVSKLKKICKKM